MSWPRLMTLALLLAAPFASAEPAYTLVKSIPLGAPDRWDYVVFDAATHRVYVAHGDQLAVVDARTGDLAGKVEGIAGGTHGTAISLATGQGFTDDGKAGTALAFDLKTLKVTKSIQAAEDADAVVAEPGTGQVLVIEGDPGTLTIIDPRSDTAVATLQAGEKMEYAAAGEPGVVYVAGNGKQEVLRVDVRRRQITARWPTPDCAAPHGLAYDPGESHVFMGCVNAKLMVVDARSGKVVTALPIGQGSDAIAFDGRRRRVFSSNGRDGTLTVYQERSPDHYEALAPVRTALSARTMALDPDSGRLFVAAADLDPPATPGGRPRAKPGTPRLMMFDPVE